MNRDDVVIRLVNILNDRFDVPYKTDGCNILMQFHEIESSVCDIWPQSENWTSAELQEAVCRCDIPNFLSTNNVRTYLLVKLSSFLPE